MSDNKWDRFKRSFGAQPSDKLVEVRNEKINDELNSIANQISRLTLAGLDAGEIGVRRAGIGNRRAEALKLKTNKEKCEALDPIKDDARKLAADAPGIVDGRLNHLATELGRLRTAISGPLDAASKHTEAGVTAAALTVTRERDLAEMQPDDEAKRVALARVDIVPLNKAITLATELGRLRAAISGPLDKASKLTVPLCQTAVAAVVLKVTQERDLAELQPNGEARRVALEQVDIDPLNKLMADASVIQTKSNILNKMLEVSNTEIGKLLDGDEKTGLNDRMTILNGENVAMAMETDLAALRRRMEVAAKTSQTLRSDVGAAYSRYEILVKNLAEARPPITSAIQTAEAIPSTVGKSVVDAALRVVKLADATAASMPDGDAKLKAFKDIALKPLYDVIRAARDMDAGVPRLLTGAATLIGKLPDSETNRTLNQELLRLHDLAAQLLPKTDLGEVRDGYANLKAPAEKLMNDAIAARGKDGMEDALTARFDLKIVVVGAAKVNLQGTYEMLDMIPESHVGHDKLIQIAFKPKIDDAGAVYWTGQGKIDMGDYEPTDTSPYVVGGKKQKVNAFNVTMLHEIGHAVDDKYGIMAGVAGQSGYGAWKKEDKHSVKKVLLDAAVGEMSNPSDQLKTDAAKLIEAALAGTDATKPDSANRSQWAKLKKYTDIASKIVAGKEPWDNAKPAEIAVGERVYLNSYKDGRWASFALAERAPTYVCDYQWRAAPEWFAEVYAVAWLTKKAPPSGVGSKMAEWLPKPGQTV